MVTDFYAPFRGGVEQHVQTLSHALVARGHDVAVATLAAGGLPPGLDADGPVRVHRLRATTQRIPGLFLDEGRPWAPPVPDPAVTVALRRIVATERPQVIHGHDWLARSALPPLLGPHGPPLVTTLHYYTRTCAKKTLLRAGRPCPGPSRRACGPCAAEHYGRVKGAVTVVGTWLGGHAERRGAAATIAVSAATAIGNGLAVPSPGLTVIPNPVERGAGSAAWPAAMPLAKGDEFLLYVGDLRPEKGVDVLLRAYASLEDPPPLVLVGDPHHHRFELPAGAVAIGEVPHDDVLTLWRHAMVGVVPSVWPEPFGIVVVEAMEAGCPLVASAAGGIPELVEDGVTGLLVTPGAADELAGAIALLLGDPPRRTALGTAAHAAARRFAPDEVAAAVEAVYDQLVV